MFITNSEEMSGEKFKEDFNQTMKSKKKYKELIKNSQPCSTPGKRPFRGGSPSDPQEEVVVEGDQYYWFQVTTKPRRS